jgi:hypothetical protein
MYNVTHEITEKTVCDIVAPTRFHNLKCMHADKSHTVIPLFSCVSFGTIHFFLTVLKRKKENFNEIYINLFITLDRLI